MTQRYLLSAVRETRSDSYPCCALTQAPMLTIAIVIIIIINIFNVA